MGTWFFNVANKVILGMGNGLQTLHDVLPPSPFQFTIDFLDKYLPWLNYLLPIGEALAILEGWCSCILIWYTVQVVMRWMKAIE